MAFGIPGPSAPPKVFLKLKQCCCMVRFDSEVGSDRLDQRRSLDVGPNQGVARFPSLVSLANGRHHSAPISLNPCKNLDVGIVDAHPERIFRGSARTASSCEGQGALTVNKTGEMLN